MTFAAAVDRANAAFLSVFGEAVLLPGAVTAVGVFLPRGAPTSASFSELGLAVRLSEQNNPVLFLLEADASELSERDALTLRGTVYLIASLDPPEDGLVRIELMEQRTDVQSPPQGARWR